jgi:two-component system cell cycle response regulator
VRVLIADDDALSRRVLNDVLIDWGYQVIVARNGNEAWEILQEEDPPNLVILDWMMSGLDGIDICAMVRQQAKPRYTYIILLTSRNRPEDIVQGLEAGADDYVVKPFNPDELKYRLKIGERIIDLEERILALARIDYLTGLLNRRAFMEKLEIEINRAQREGTNLGIIIIDIDYFKSVNDTYGHLVGDRVLQNLARCLQKSCRRYDFAGRYGGEEFILGFPGAGKQSIQKIADRLCRDIRQCYTELPEHGTGIHVTASLGVACLEDFPSGNPDQLISAADDALYTAKKKGRNQVVIANPSHNAN